MKNILLTALLSIISFSTVNAAEKTTATAGVTEEVYRFSQNASFTDHVLLVDSCHEEGKVLTLIHIKTNHTVRVAAGDTFSVYYKDNPSNRAGPHAKIGTVISIEDCVGTFSY